MINAAAATSVSALAVLGAGTVAPAAKSVAGAGKAAPPGGGAAFSLAVVGGDEKPATPSATVGEDDTGDDDRHDPATPGTPLPVTVDPMFAWLPSVTGALGPIAQAGSTDAVKATAMGSASPSVALSTAPADIATASPALVPVASQTASTPGEVQADLVHAPTIPPVSTDRDAASAPPVSPQSQTVSMLLASTALSPATPPEAPERVVTSAIQSNASAADQQRSTVAITPTALVTMAPGEVRVVRPADLMPQPARFAAAQSVRPNAAASVAPQAIPASPSDAATVAAQPVVALVPPAATSPAPTVATATTSTGPETLQPPPPVVPRIDLPTPARLRATDETAAMPLPVAPASDPVLPTAGTTAPAADVFGAIRAAASREDKATPLDAATLATGTTPVELRHAVAATGDAQQTPLDMSNGRWPHAMIDRIETLRTAAADAANATDTRIRLVPDGLGSIQVSVKQEGATLHVHFAAEQAATAQLIQDAQPRLAAIAQERGLTLGQTAVDTGGAGQGQGFGQAQSFGQQADGQPGNSSRQPTRFSAPSRAPTNDSDPVDAGRLA